MKLSRWFPFLFLLIFMLNFRAVDDDGAGGDGDGDEGDIDDFDVVDDDEDKGKGKEVDKKIDDPPPDEKELSAIEELQAFRAEIENEKLVVFETNELIKKHSDFDITKIYEKMKTMEPAEQEKFNNPVGWELLHLQYFQEKAVEFDPFDTGRGASKEPFDFSGAYEKLEQGDRSVVADLIANSR